MIETPIFDSFVFLDGLYIYFTLLSNITKRKRGVKIP